MSDYQISKVYPSDKRTNRLVSELLIKEGIRKDGNLDYTCAMFDDDMNVIATGSCFGNTLRCMAVDSSHQGEGLMNEIVTHLMEVQFARGNMHLFLYTKCNSAKFFGDLGFYEIVRVDGQIVFMENRKTGFSGYLEELKKETESCEAYDRLTEAMDGSSAEPSVDRTASTDGSTTSKPVISALVMNANPFTLGHQYLVETAAASCDLLHLFIVSEDASLVPFSVRKKLVMEGTAHLNNICYHESGPYIISSATFPSYFQKDESAVIESHARLDLAVFTRISEALGITCRYVGEEPTSLVTGMYNEIMAAELPKAGIQCRIIPRKEANGRPISASTVRQCLKDGDMETLKTLVPGTTLRYFESPEAALVIEKIRAEANVIHY